MLGRTLVISVVVALILAAGGTASPVAEPDVSVV